MNKILGIGFLSLTLGLLLFGCLGGGDKKATPTPPVVSNEPTATPVTTSVQPTDTPVDLPTISDEDLAGLDGIDGDSDALGDLDDEGPEFPEE